MKKSRYDHITVVAKLLEMAEKRGLSKTQALKDLESIFHFDENELETYLKQHPTGGQNEKGTT